MTENRDELVRRVADSREVLNGIQQLRNGNWSERLLVETILGTAEPPARSRTGGRSIQTVTSADSTGKRVLTKIATYACAVGETKHPRSSQAL
jgi:hypothetical protein